jgi:hypothetical protein
MCLLPVLCEFERYFGYSKRMFFEELQAIFVLLDLHQDTFFFGMDISIVF